MVVIEFLFCYCIILDWSWFGNYFFILEERLDFLNFFLEFSLIVIRYIGNVELLFRLCFCFGFVSFRGLVGNNKIF